MTLTQLKGKLKIAGYSPYLHEDLHTLYCCIADESGQPRFDTMCQVRAQNEKYSCMYFGISFNTKKIFNSAKELLSFIQKKFPVTTNTVV